MTEVKREVIKSESAPAAIGPYSQAILCGPGRMLFVSGQIPLNPLSGELVSSDVEEQTHQVLKNMDAILKAAHGNLGHVVKTTIYLQDMNEFAKVNAIYAGYFPHDPPARATVQVARLPKDVRVEIDAIAVLSI